MLENALAFVRECTFILFFIYNIADPAPRRGQAPHEHGVHEGPATHDDANATATVADTLAP